MQKQIIHSDNITHKPKTPFRSHLYKNKSLMTFHQSNTKLYRKMLFMDNLFLKLPSKSFVESSSTTSFGASLIAFVAIEQSQPLYKKLRSFFIHKDTMHVQPYFNIFYHTHPQTKRRRLLVEPMLMQKKDETRRSSNNRVRYSPFKSICLLSDFYWSCLPHVQVSKTRKQNATTTNSIGSSIVQNNQVMHYLKQKQTSVLHPSFVTKVYSR